MKYAGLALVKRGGSYSFSPTEGITLIPEYEGLNEAIAGVAGQYRSSGIPFRVLRDGPTSIIEAEHQLPDDGSAEYPHGSWALIGQQEVVDWRQRQEYLALREAEQAVINDALNNVTRFTPTAMSTLILSDGQTISEMGLVFYRLALEDQRHYARTNYTLRHNLTVSQTYEARLSGDNVNRVYTTAQLLSECGSFADPLPPLLIAEINAIPALTEQTGYIYGWLKQTPTIQTVAGGRVECSVEYVREVWPRIFYPEIA